VIKYNKGVILRMIGKTKEAKKAFLGQTGLHRQQVVNLVAGGYPSIETLCKIATGMRINDMNTFFKQ